jgi:hypothetical protein
MIYTITIDSETGKVNIAADGELRFANIPGRADTVIYSSEKELPEGHSGRLVGVLKYITVKFRVGGMSYTRDCFNQLVPPRSVRLRSTPKNQIR